MHLVLGTHWQEIRHEKWYFYIKRYCIYTHFPTSYLLKAIVQICRMVAAYPASQYCDCQLFLLTKLNYQKGRVAVLTRKQPSPLATCMAFLLCFWREYAGRNPSCQASSCWLPAVSPLTLLYFCSQPIEWSAQDVDAQEQRQVFLHGQAGTRELPPSPSARCTLVRCCA